MKSPSAHSGSQFGAERDPNRSRGRRPVARLGGRTAIVSGAASGMGAAAARRFIDEGANVTLPDLDVDGAQKVAAELGPNVLVLDLDVRSPEQWSGVVAKTEAQFGRLDILVNSAGAAEPAPLADWDLARLRRTLDVNLIGVFNGIQAAAPAMRRAGGGSIVNVGSVGALQGIPMLSGYVASKWAVRGLTKSAALEFGVGSIRVNAVHPGQINTPMTRGITFETDQIALGRVGQPEDIPDIILFFASDDSRFVTGSEVAGDGGQIAGQANYSGVPT